MKTYELRQEKAHTLIGLLAGRIAEKAPRNLSTTMGHSTGLIREQCPVW